MLNRFNSFEREVIPLLVVRSPYQHFVSNIQQQIKLGCYTPWLALGNLCRCKPGLEINDQIFSRYLKIIETCLQTFGSSLKIISFEELCSSDLGLTRTILRDFLGLKAQIYENIEEVFANESFSNLTIRLQNQLNKRSNKLVPGVGGKNSSHFEFPPSIGKNDKFLLTKEEFDHHSKSLRICEEKLTKMIGSSFVNRNYRYSIPVSDDELLDSISEFWK